MWVCVWFMTFELSYLLISISRILQFPCMCFSLWFLDVAWNQIKGPWRRTRYRQIFFAVVLVDQTSCHGSYYLRALPFNYYYVKLIALRWTKIEKWNWSCVRKKQQQKLLAAAKTFQFPLESFLSKYLSSIALCFYGVVVVFNQLLILSRGMKRIIIFVRIRR